MSDERGAFARATGRTARPAGACAGGEDDGADKPRYRRYQYDLIAPHCGRSVLEVGAGLGEFAAVFADRHPDLDRLVVTDVDPDAVEVLVKRLADRAQPGGHVEVRRLDLTAGERLDRPVETALAINVLEHFEDDAGLLRQLAQCVVPGGTIVLWVPGYQSLYGEFDRSVGHVRRYTPATLRDAALRAGLAVETARPVNLLGGLAWWAAVRLGRAGSPQGGAVAVYDRVVVPATRVLDGLLRVPFGQSILCVARTPRH